MRNVKRLLWSVLLSVILERSFFVLNVVGDQLWCATYLLFFFFSFLTPLTRSAEQTSSWSGLFYSWMLRYRPAQTGRSSICFFFYCSDALKYAPNPALLYLPKCILPCCLVLETSCPGGPKFLPKWIHAHLHLSLVWASVDIPQAVSCLPNSIYIFFTRVIALSG